MYMYVHTYMIHDSQVIEASYMYMYMYIHVYMHVEDFNVMCMYSRYSSMSFLSFFLLSTEIL